MRKGLRISFILCGIFLLIPSTMSAQSATCVDTTEHQSLLHAMWDACGGNDKMKVFDACKRFQQHADKDGDLEAHYNAWVCGITFCLDHMNISDAYHIVKLMTDDLHTGAGGKDEQYLAPNMLEQVYNTVISVVPSLSSRKP